MKTRNVSISLAFLSLLFAAVASSSLMFLPLYNGVSSSSRTTTSATLIEVNGVWVIILLIVPLLLTGAALLAIWRIRDGSRTRKFAIWTLTALMAAFVILSSLSIGMFYAPPAVLLFIAAMLAMRKPVTVIT